MTTKIWTDAAGATVIGDPKEQQYPLLMAALATAARSMWYSDVSTMRRFCTCLRSAGQAAAADAIEAALPDSYYGYMIGGS